VAESEVGYDRQVKVIVQNIATEYTDEGLSASRQGEGMTLLMLPGWMNTIRDFDALASRLVSTYRIVRLDFPGFKGGTEAPPSDWGVKEYAAFVRAFIEKIGLTSYVLIGHSFGGRVAIRGVGEGTLHPSRLILIASAGIAKHRTFRNRAFTVLAKVAKILMLVPPLSLWRAQLRKKLYKKLGSDYLAAGALSNMYLKVIREDLQEYARKISIPTLLIWGSDDDMVPLSDGMLFNSLIKGSQLEVFPGVGHSPHVDCAEEVAKLIEQFV